MCLPGQCPRSVLFQSKGKVIKIKHKIFADSEVNLTRQKELDLARAIMIYCLAYIHVTIECSTDEALCSGIPYLFDTVIGGPFSAPMYMFAMGIGMSYTKNFFPADHFRKGIKLILMGYLLNICRFLIPYSIGYAITGDHGMYIEPLLYKVLCNDILTFAGLSMVLLSILIKFDIPRVMMVALATVMCAFGTLLNGVDVGTPLGNIFLGYLIGTEDAAGLVLSDFPLLNWMMFPTCGYVFGRMLRRVKNKDLFYLIVSLPASIIAVVYFTIGIYTESGMFGEGQNCYYHMIFSDVLASLCLTVGLIGIYHFISKILPDKIHALARNISQRITSVYCIHWVIVTFTANLFMYVIRGTTILTSGQILALGTVISIVSILLANCYTTLKERGRGNEKTP